MGPHPRGSAPEEIADAKLGRWGRGGEHNEGSGICQCDAIHAGEYGEMSVGCARRWREGYGNGTGVGAGRGASTDTDTGGTDGGAHADGASGADGKGAHANADGARGVGARGANADRRGHGVRTQVRRARMAHPAVRAWV